MVKIKEIKRKLLNVDVLVFPWMCNLNQYVIILIK